MRILERAVDRLLEGKYTATAGKAETKSLTMYSQSNRVTIRRTAPK